MQLNYREYGSGEPVIILHGLLGMLDNWHSFAKKLAEDYWVISVDQRNHGKSFHSDEFDYKLLAQDLTAFLDEMHIPRCHIIGHSMGGKTVMQALNDINEYIDKAIIVDISPKAYAGGHEKVFEALLSVDLSTITSRNQVQEQLMKYLNDLGTVLFLMKNLQRLPEGGFKWKANVEVLNRHYSAISSEISFDYSIDNECLFVKGSKSQYIIEPDEYIEANFEDFTLETIEDAGHWIHADQPDSLLISVKNFLKA